VGDRTAPAPDTAPNGVWKVHSKPVTFKVQPTTAKEFGAKLSLGGITTIFSTKKKQF